MSCTAFVAQMWRLRWRANNNNTNKGGCWVSLGASTCWVEGRGVYAWPVHSNELNALLHCWLVPCCRLCTAAGPTMVVDDRCCCCCSALASKAVRQQPPIIQEQLVHSDNHEQRQFQQTGRETTDGPGYVVRSCCHHHVIATTLRLNLLGS